MGKSDHKLALPRLPDADRSAGPAAAEAVADQDGTFFPESADSGIAQGILTALTDKQRAVLDLLIEHKTSKEISRILGISHHTVDQRIMLARAKLGVATRAEVAQAYRRLVASPASVSAISERTVYDFSDVAPLADVQQDRRQEDRTDWSKSPPSRRDAPQRAVYRSDEALVEPYHHVLPEMFDGPYGTLLRLGTIAAFALFLILIVMGGLAMFAQLSQIIAH